MLCGDRERIYVYVQLVHFAVEQKQTQLQQKINNIFIKTKVRV